MGDFFVETDNTNVYMIDWSKYFYMLMLFLWCAYTAPFLKFVDPSNLISSAFFMFIYWRYYSTYCWEWSQQPMMVWLSIMLFWYFAQCIKVGGITLIDFRLFYSLFLCHVAFYLYNEKEFFFYFEKVLVHLTIISLFVWFAALIAQPAMRAIFDVISVWDNEHTTYGNFIFVALGNQESMGLLRNIGFTWEAGRFASFLVIGMFVSLLNCEMRIKYNVNFWILTFGLLSTLSTTGIVASLGVVLLYLYNKSRLAKVALVSVCILTFPALWGMDYIGGKILESADVTQEMSNMTNSFLSGARDSITPQRITGLFLEFQNWIHDFWFGYNLNENSYTQSVLFNGNEVWLSNGVLMIFSKYGILVGLFFYIMLFKSSRIIIADFGYKGSYLFAFIFILINVSYDFWSSGIFLYFVLYYLYKKYNTSDIPIDEF